MTAPTPKERAEARQAKLVDRMNEALFLLEEALPHVPGKLATPIRKLLDGDQS